MATLRVRAYNVHFGDAILVTVPDQGTTRHVLIDVGNVLSKEGGDDTVFKAVVEDVIRELGGKPLDLYVMTHEHLDHVQGLYYAATTHALELKADWAWLTASAAPDYYTKHPDAKKKLELLRKAYAALGERLKANPFMASDAFAAILANNNPSSTAECVDFLRKLAPAAHTTYVSRGSKLSGRHPFKEVKFSIWAPEEDTSDYYGRVALAGLGFDDSSGTAAPAATLPMPPPGVDAGAFYSLVDHRAGGLVDSLLAIDAAANNTSVVFCLEWRGWKLLFAGDAEIKSWKTMDAKGVLEPVHFLKVSHHGSHNGTPADGLLEKVLPESPPDSRPRTAVISTWTDTYSGIPHTATNNRIEKRCTLSTILQHKSDPYVDLTFEG